MIKSVYIYGLGMMGGSLARAVKKSKITQKIYAYDISKSNLSFAKKNKIIDNYDQDDFKHLSNADLIIICAPIGAYKKIFNNIKKYKSKMTVIYPPVFDGKIKFDAGKEFYANRNLPGSMGFGFARK